jgi:hypothetical protein
MGYAVEVTAEMTALASKSLETDVDVDEVVRVLADSHAAIFGVFAAPVQASLATSTAADVEATTAYGAGHGLFQPCFSAWNITRTPEGGKPTFTHHKWVNVGMV